VHSNIAIIKEVASEEGYFFQPTILKNVQPNMEIAQEEVFGPVAPIITVDDEKDAMEIANDSNFGLWASIWTQNLDKAEKLSEIVEAGVVTVNRMVVSDPFANIKSVRFYDELIYYHYVE
jgi:acyl-CoA reductase-like NAD-dependent aldehyde dehydrogenase